MTSEWSDDQPIYRQLQNKVCSLILNGTYQEGDAVPSVRQVSSDLSINHLTVSKAYQALVDEGLLEKKRGLGMFVVEGAKSQLMAHEKEKFITSELPAFIHRVNQLEIPVDDIVEAVKRSKEQV